ncbi:MAG: NAD(P)-dependent oxidoreductase [Rhodothermales bacterium]|nr:NAD(P)-dependent oxidoreductase [Rhodothermales bacterium]
MKPRKIFVTGAGGFIGRELCDHLVAKGHTVTGLDISYPDDSAGPRPNMHVGDYRDIPMVKDLVAGHDAVIHLASAHLDVSLSEQDYRDINVGGLRGLLSLCSDAGVRRFCHVSSVSVYGNLATWPATESTECHPQSIYGETKLAGETVVQSHPSESEMTTVILRPAWVYGATCPRTRRLIRAIRKGTFVIFGRGQNVRHPIYIKDMLHAFDLVLEDGAVHGEVLITGGPEIVTTRQLVDTVCDVFELRRRPVRLPMWMGSLAARVIEAGSTAVGARPPVSHRTLEFFNTNNGFDISKARTRAGFEPQFTLREGLSEIRSALEQQHDS